MVGTWILFEGSDGSGKTTQVKLLVQALKDEGFDVLSTREPTSLSSAGQRIKRQASNTLHPNEDPITDGLEWATLFAADRKHLVAHSIQPHLEKGNKSIVISDRHAPSTLAYQHAQGIALDPLLALHEGLPYPDITFFIDVPVDIAHARVLQAKKEQRDENLPTDTFENRAILEKIRKNYMYLFGNALGNPYHAVTIDGNRTIREIAQEIKEIALKKIKKE